MVTLTFVFYMFIVIFAIIGAMRGWAKELLVSFSVILALAFGKLVEQYILFNPNNPSSFNITPESETLFWIRTTTLLLLVFFGYQTVNLPTFAKKAARERLQDLLLGSVFGGVNGYLVVGSIWAYMAEANYPFSSIINPVLHPAGLSNIMDPTVYTEYIDTIEKLLAAMPPYLLGVPGIYFAVIIAFIFIIVVYI